MIRIIFLTLFAATAVTAQQNCTALAYAGDCGFYDCLSTKFECGSTDYLLAYSKKFCQRLGQYENLFTNNGQVWIDNVKVCLMKTIVNSNAYANPNTTCFELQIIAFDSHPSCYVDNGFCSDILINQTNIVSLKEVFTLTDYLSLQALNQVYTTGSLCSQNAINTFLGFVDNLISTTTDLVAVNFLTTLKDFLGSCKSGIDLIFVLDASGSIGSQNFARMKNFIINVTSTFDIGPDLTQVGVIRYATTTNIEIPLGYYDNKNTLIEAINNITYTGGGTYTHEALDLLITAFNNSRADQGIPSVAVVTTDGRSANFPLTTKAAEAVNNASITAYSFGIGSSINMNELIAIAGNNTENVFLIDNFSADSFATQLQPLKRTTCTTPFSGTIGIQLEVTLQINQSRLLEYEFPDEGMTISINVTEGMLQVYGSFTVTTPTVLTADFTVQSEDEQPDINFFVSPTLYENSTTLTGNTPQKMPDNANRKLYLAIVGLSSNNKFLFDTAPGDTTPPHITPSTATPTTATPTTATPTEPPSGSGKLCGQWITLVVILIALLIGYIAA